MQKKLIDWLPVKMLTWVWSHIDVPTDEYYPHSLVSTLTSRSLDCLHFLTTFLFQHCKILLGFYRKILRQKDIETVYYMYMWESN